MNSQTYSKLSLSLDELIAKNPVRFYPKKGKRKTTQASTLSINRKLNNAKKKQPNIAGKNSMKVKKTIKKKKNVSVQGMNHFLYTIKVTGIGSEVTENMLKSRFGVCGKILNVNILKNGIAYVAYSDANSCVIALKDLQGVKLKGDVLSVKAGKPIANKNIRPNNKKNISSGTTLHPRSNINNLNIQRKLNTNYNNMYNIIPARTDHNNNKNYMNNSYIDGYNANVPTYMASPLMYAPSVDGVNKSSFTSLTGKVTPSNATVIISNVPLDLTAQEIKDAFCCVGAIAKAEVLLNSSGDHTGRAAVVYESRLCAEEAVRRFDGGDLNNNKIRVFLE